MHCGDSLDVDRLGCVDLTAEFCCAAIGCVWLYAEDRSVSGVLGCVTRNIYMKLKPCESGHAGDCGEGR